METATNNQNGLKNQWGLVLVALVAVLGLTACGGANTFSTSKALENDETNIVHTQEILKCTTKTNESGLVYDEALDTDQAPSAEIFQKRVEDFVSVLFDPKDNLGDVVSSKDPANAGLTFKGSLKIGADSKIVLSEANLVITIADSLTGQDNGNGGKIPAIQMGFYKAVSATHDSVNKKITVVFEDAYGSLTIDGTYDAAQFKGLVSFKNIKTFDNVERSGTLGAFVISRCAILL